MTDHKTGTREEWLEARLGLLEAEKKLTKRGDANAVCLQISFAGKVSETRSIVR